MKKFTVLALSILGLALVLTYTGCTVANNPTTTAGAISGTITLPGIAGNLWVGATTVSDFVTTEGWIETKQQVTASDTTYNYSLPISAPGTYYVVAILRGGTTESSAPPTAGNRAGEYFDGKIPSSWSQTPSGTPTPIVVASGASVTGKDFDLKVTWSSTTVTADTISGTITLPGDAGHLWVGATTDPTFSSGVYPGESNYTVAAGVTTYNYSLPMSAAGTGTYYVIAVLAVGQTSYPGPLPLANDRVGEYADGAVPASFGQLPPGTPTPIAFTSGAAVTGKDFQLNVLWH